MTLEQYRNLPIEEQEFIISTLENMEYPVPENLSGGLTIRNLLDIEFYYENRYKEREKITNISWPINLSKKERVICKIEMIQRLLETSIQAENDQDATIINSMILFCKSIKSNIYKHKSSLDGPKWPGIPVDAANILNVLYKPLVKSFQKKYQI